MSDAMREEFERWYARPEETQFVQECDGYIWHDANVAWEAWQAAHAAGRRAGLEEAARLCDLCKEEAHKGLPGSVSRDAEMVVEATMRITAQQVRELKDA